MAATTTSKNGPVATNDQPAEHTANAAIFSANQVERQVFDALAARAAMKETSLHELASGGYLLCRWGLSRELPDLRSVAAMLAQMGARP